MLLHNLDQYFRFRCLKGLRQKSLADRPEYQDRLKEELSVITKAGFCGYLLIVADFIAWAKRNGVPYGPGRGSAAGSLCVYCLGITQLDPIKYGLIFQRFLNPDRVAPPDLDLDFCMDRRQEVIDYVTQRYGADKVAHIGTFGTMRSRGAIRDVARALGLPFETSNKLASLTLPPVLGKPPKLEECFKKVPELAKIRDSETIEGQVLRLAQRLEGKIRSFGSHASGLIISERPLYLDVPLALDKDDKPVTQFDMHSVEDIGLIKFDFLGLTTLTVMARALELIKQRHGVEIDINATPDGDEATYENLRTGDTVGVFQLEASAGIRDLVVNIRPRNLDDLAATVSIYRPGPLGSEHMSKYLKVRSGEEKPEYLIPELEPILSKTSGWMILQEQALEIAKTIAGYTLAEADLLRRAIGKKKADEMEAQEAKFKAGVLTKGHSQNVADRLWEDINYFSGYSFCAAHAYCYAFITYQTAWLKTHYPIEFMCAALQSNKDNEDQVTRYITECRRVGIKVLPPDVNESSTDFSIVADKTIRFGLAAVKNLGGSPVSFLIQARSQPFSGLVDFASRVDQAQVNRKKLESLVLAGAFDFGNQTRASMMAGVEAICVFRESLRRYESKLETYRNKKAKFDEREKQILHAQLAGKPIPKPLKAPERPFAPAAPEVPQLPEMSLKELLAKERELLGFFVSGHPLDGVDTAAYGTIERASEQKPGAIVQFVAVPSVSREITTKAGKKKMCFVLFEDLTGQIEGAVFPAIYDKVASLLSEVTPVVVKGSLEVAETDESRTAKIRVDSITAATRAIPTHSITSLVLPLTERSLFGLRGANTCQQSQHRAQISFRGQDGTMYLGRGLVGLADTKSLHILEELSIQ